jgi:pimeloyl-ACP methyl ester carboxylesterase
MTTFVLVPGFWLGGWAWSDVTARLRAAGHAVYPVTLTGLGERVHLSSPHVDLDTHITDIVNTLAYEDLHEIVLVGHSYAGVVITGVADRLPERIARLIYVDTAPLPDGVAQADFGPPEVRRQYEQRVAEPGDGWRLALPSWEELDQGGNLDGLDQAARARMRGRATDQPLRTSLQPLRLSNPARAQLPKTAIWCTFSSAQVREIIASGAPLFSELAGPEWQFIDLPTGHWPMFSRPADLAALLLDAVS